MASLRQRPTMRMLSGSTPARRRDIAPLERRERAAMLEGLTPACPGMEMAAARSRLVIMALETQRRSPASV